MLKNVCFIALISNYLDNILSKLYEKQISLIILFIIIYIKKRLNIQKSQTQDK